MRTPKGLSASSLPRYLSTAKLVLDFAGVEPNTARDHRVKLPKQSYEEVNPPTCKQFLSILDRVPQAKRLALIVMEQCALEPGVISTLTWGDVDVAESRFRLPRKNVKGNRSVRARNRQVPQWLMGIIEERCPLEDRTADRPVFGGTTDAYNQAMRRACVAAGAPAFSPTIFGTAGSVCGTGKASPLLSLLLGRGTLSPQKRWTRTPTYSLIRPRQPKRN
jgi:integrase